MKTILMKRKKSIAYDTWNMRLVENDLKSIIHKLETKSRDVKQALNDAFNYGDRAYLATVHRFLDEQRELIANSILADENDENMLTKEMRRTYDVDEFGKSVITVLKRRDAETVAHIAQIWNGQRGTHYLKDGRLTPDDVCSPEANKVTRMPSPAITPPPQHPSSTFARKKAFQTRPKWGPDGKPPPEDKFTANLVDAIPYARNVSVGNTALAAAQTKFQKQFMAEHVIYSEPITLGDMYGDATVAILGERHMSMRVVFECFDMPVFIYAPMDFISLDRETCFPTEPIGTAEEVDREWWEIGRVLTESLEVDYEKARFTLRGLESFIPRKNDVVVTVEPLMTMVSLIWSGTVFKPEEVCNPTSARSSTTSTTHDVDFLNVNLYNRSSTHFGRHYYNIQFYDVASGRTLWIALEYRTFVYFLELPLLDELDPALISPSKLNPLITFAFGSNLEETFPSPKREREPFISMREVIDADLPMCGVYGVEDLGENEEDNHEEEEFDEYETWQDNFDTGISIELIFTAEALSCSFFTNSVVTIRPSPIEVHQPNTRFLY